MSTITAPRDHAAGEMRLLSPQPTGPPPLLPPPGSPLNGDHVANSGSGNKVQHLSMYTLSGDANVLAVLYGIC